MKTKEVLVVGAGIAGCAVALALAKRKLAVTIMTSPFDQRIYHAPFIQQDKLEEKVQSLQKGRQEEVSCSQAYEQLSSHARQSLDELLPAHSFVDRNGNLDVHRCLQDQLKQYSNVEWIHHHSVIELLTLDQHGQKKTDRYKKPTCIGSLAYNHETQKLEYFLAKETILATGGASSLFPYSAHLSTAYGGGLAIAHRAGVRLLNMDQIQFHPLGLFEKDRPCFPLPIELLLEGGKIYTSKTTPLELDLSSPDHLSRLLYGQLLRTGREHLWLDLTLLDPLFLKEKFPAVDSYCLNHGFNIVKDPLPIVPIAFHTCGGIAVDKKAQTNLQRLRAIGGIACTGLFWNSKEEVFNILESVTWASACAEDIANQIHKFMYYFPAIREGVSQLNSSFPVLEEDWRMLRQIMWFYIGFHHNHAHLERGYALLNQLALFNNIQDFSSCSIEQIQLHDAIQTAQLIAHSIRMQQRATRHDSPRFHFSFQNQS